MKSIVIIGTSGAIGESFVRQFSSRVGIERVYAFSRSIKSFNDVNIVEGNIDLLDEKSIERASKSIPDDVKIDAIIIATGVLHGEGFSPEKSLRDLTAEKFSYVFAANTTGPALIIKYFSAYLHKDQRSVVAILSARVGSISDNVMGGWYAYRASKAALNMIIKNTAIEFRRTHKQSIVVGLHPGTVDSELSEPFQGNVNNDKLFSPDYSVSQMIDVIEKVSVEDSGKCMAYNFEEILP